VLTRQMQHTSIADKGDSVNMDGRINRSYRDHSNVNDDVQNLTLSNGLPMGISKLVSRLLQSDSRGNEVVFPVKLHETLENAEKAGLSNIVSWQPHGRCFLVHDQNAFVEEVLKKRYGS